MARPAVALAALLLMLAFASPAHAHKLKVFATAVGAEIDGRVYFVGSGPAPGARISVETGDAQPLVTLQADADGRFSFVATSRVEHLISADTGDGHSARTTIAADALPASLPSPAGAPVALVTAAAASSSLPAAATTSAAGAIAVEDVVALAVAQQIRPLREEINAYEDQIRLRDITGGIGYIVGLAGLTLWLRGRQRERRR
jgi:hypothetical protein